MQIIFHGGAQEVGRSCFELRTRGDRYLLDCGVKFHSGGMDYPAKVFESKTLDGVFLSHAHMDHSGGLPFFEHFHMSCPIIATPETKAIVPILLKDSERITHIRHGCEPFEKMDVQKSVADMQIAPYTKDRQLRSIQYTLFNAGHIPGSACIRIRTEGKTILYTGDYNTEETELMQRANPKEWGEVDILITESTYGGKQREEREKIEAEFLEHVAAAVKRGGSVLIPVFALGRAQEILLTLARRKWNVPIYMDGMAKKITRATIDGPSPYVNNKSRLRDVFADVRTVSGNRQRERALAGQGIYISTSGMLEGGPAVRYLEHLAHDPKSAVFLTGFQVHGTNGWLLDTEKLWRQGGEQVKVECEVARFDFSAHISGAGVQETILAVNPKVVILVHGSPEATAYLMQWAREHTQAQVFAPTVGDQIDIDDGTVTSIHAYTQDDSATFYSDHQHGEWCEPAREHINVEHDE